MKRSYPENPTPEFLAKRAAYMRAWTAKNREKKRAWDARYYHKNKAILRPKMNAYNRLYHQRPEVRERERKYASEWARNNHDKINARLRAWKKAHPKIIAARRAVKRALEAGVLVRPAECALCLKPAKTQAHHPDYRKKLSVVWLCLTCHHDQHRTLVNGRRLPRGAKTRTVRV